jgi:threonylcarbamoyladenosine tRNA methylthiotransferase CDKAL1
MKYIYIETYGCSANQNNSEILKGILTRSGYLITNNPQIADILIINTCIVKSKTENKIKRRIQDLSKDYPSKLMIIAGCMPETDAKQIQQLNPKALVLGTHNFKRIINLISDFNHNQLTTQKQEDYLRYKDEEKILLPKIPNNKLISITQISEGCLGNCSFCKTRLAKGKLFSYDINKILKSIESDLQNGAKEVWLTSQDCAAYGLDFKENKEKKSKLQELLNRILSLKHNFKLRLGMSNPNHIIPILEELLILYENPKLYKFLHLPIQSASDKVLSDMRRKYKIKEVYGIIKKFKKRFPDIVIATDIITGYPTETEKDHKENIKFIQEIKPDVLNLSKLSLHKGTEIYRLINNNNNNKSRGSSQSSKRIVASEEHRLYIKNNINEIPINIINKRATELMELHRETAKENKKKYLDKKIQVFINKKTDLGYEARDDSYNIVIIPSKERILGKKLEVIIKKIGVHHMIGFLENEK